MLALLLAAAFLVAAPAAAIVVLESGGFSAGVGRSDSTTYVTVSTTTQRVDLSRTRIVGRDVHGAAVYDHSFDLPFADATVQAAVTAARQAAVAASAPQVVTVSDPALQSHGVALVSRDSAAQELSRSTQASTLDVNTLVGPQMLCTGYAQGSGQGVPPSCDPAAVPGFISPGGILILARQLDATEIRQTMTNTDTYRTTEEYLLTATAGADAAQVPTLSEWGLLALGLALATAGLWRLRAGGAACLLVILLAGSSRGAAQTITLASRSAGAASDTAGGTSTPIASSTDGRYLLFRSDAVDLVPGQVDRDGGDDLFLRDLTAGTTVLVTHAAGSLAVAGNMPAFEAALSADGRYVAFVSLASDLVPGYVDNSPYCGSSSVLPRLGGQLYLFDRDNPDATLLVSRKSGTTVSSGNACVLHPSISDDGRFVTFDSAARDLVAGQQIGGSYVGFNRIFLFDRDNPGSTALVSHRFDSQVTSGTPGGTTSSKDGSARVSGDGNFVAYFSTSNDLVASQSGYTGVFLYERATGQNVLVSHTGGSATQVADPGNRGWQTTDGPIVTTSADGRWVAYLSAATNLVAGQVDTNGATDLFLFDRTTGAVTMVSHHLGTPARAGTRSSGLPVVSADGRRVAYESQSTDLSPLQDDTNDTTDVFLYDRTTDATLLVSHAPSAAGKCASGASTAPSLSADGRFVAFTSLAADLVAGSDANSKSDVFLFDASTGSVTLVSHGASAAATAAGDASTRPMVSADGSWVLFTSLATNLVAGQTDTNTVRDLFLCDRATGANVLVSHAAGLPATAANGLSDGGVLSSDGRFVAWVSTAGNVVAGQSGPNTGALQVFLWDRTNGGSTLVSHLPGSPSTAASSLSFDATISADGRTVAFSSLAADLVTGMPHPFADVPAIYLHDRTTGTNLLASRSTRGPLVCADSDSFHPLLSADGTTIAFASFADDLDPLVLDANRLRDVYLYTRP